MTRKNIVHCSVIIIFAYECQIEEKETEKTRHFFFYDILLHMYFLRV